MNVFTSTVTSVHRDTIVPFKEFNQHKPRVRIQSIDLLRGIVMVVMALDHVRDYFHRDAFYFSPTDLDKTSAPLFFTRFITHYCAPVFVFLAGLSSYLSGTRKSKTELADFLLKRGLWLIFAEIVILNFFRTFNPLYSYLNFQVIWAIGVSMISLSAVIFCRPTIIFSLGIILVAGHNLLDGVHAPGNGGGALMWSVLHEMKHFQFGHFSVYIHYPVLPWIGIMFLGYSFGRFYNPDYSVESRMKLLLLIGCMLLGWFVLLRSTNAYGDPSSWSGRNSFIDSVMSFVNVTKYPPSLLYALITLGPALIILGLMERRPPPFAKILFLFGRVPMFYYLLHILLIHTLATIAAGFTGYRFSDMILSTGINNTNALKGFGFDLFGVYFIWSGVIVMLYPLCKWFDGYKTKRQSDKWWLRYL